MATYVPVATDATEPVASRFVGSAAEEFRTLKASINARVDALEDDFDRAIKAPSPEVIIGDLPSILTRAGKVLGFDAGGAPLALSLSGSLDPNLRADLAVSVDSSLGPALIGHSIGQLYTVGTVGNYLNRGNIILPTKIQFGGSVIDRTLPYYLTVQGSSVAPVTDQTYKTPAIYVERHTNGANADSCDWGNVKKNALFLAEAVVYGAETAEVNGFAARVFTATTEPVGAQPLVGVSAVAQSNAPAGTNNREIFGANFIVASSMGNKPINMVGIEVDVIPSQSATTLRPGEVGADNFTAYWAQSAGGTVTSNTAFFVSATGTGGWNYGMVIDCNVQAYLQYLRTTVNAPSAKGVRVETQFQSNAGRLLELFCGGLEYMRVDGDSNSPVWIRSEGTLKQITAGAADSAGAGFKFLKVVN